MSDECAPYEFIECYANVWLWSLAPMILIVIGTIGNVLNIIVLTRERMKRYSTTVYLITLAISDMAFVITSLFPEFLNKAFSINIRAMNEVFCKGYSWVATIFASYSTWALVLMTFERMFLTISPILARTKLTVKNAMMVSGITFTLCFFWPFHFLFGFEIQTWKLELPYGEYGNETYYMDYTNCFVKNAAFIAFYRDHMHILTLVFMNIIPLSVIVAGNATIFFALMKQQRRLRKVNTNTNTTTSESGAKQIKNYNKQKSSTKTLFLICGTYLLTTCPYNIARVVVANTDQSEDPKAQAQTTLFTTCTIILLYFNFTVNFFLYFLSGTMFKEEWNRLTKDTRVKLRKMFRRPVPAAPSVTATPSETTPAELY